MSSKTTAGACRAPPGFSGRVIMSASSPWSSTSTFSTTAWGHGRLRHHLRLCQAPPYHLPRRRVFFVSSVSTLAIILILAIVIFNYSKCITKFICITGVRPSFQSIQFIQFGLSHMFKLSCVDISSIDHNLVVHIWKFHVWCIELNFWSRSLNTIAKTMFATSFHIVLN